MNGSMSKPFYPATLRNTLASVFKGTYLGFSRWAFGNVNFGVPCRTGKQSAKYR